MTITITDADGKEIEETVTVTVIDAGDYDAEMTEEICLMEDDIPMMLSEVKGIIDIKRGSLRMYIDLDESSDEKGCQSTEYVSEDDSLMADISSSPTYNPSEIDYFSDLDYPSNDEPLQTKCPK